MISCLDCEHYSVSSCESPCCDCYEHDLFEPSRNIGGGGGGAKAEQKPSDEMVNHPKHYNMHCIEPINVIEDWKLNFNLGSTVKYIARCDYKENPIQDLEKALWYLNREIERRKAHA